MDEEHRVKDHLGSGPGLHGCTLLLLVPLAILPLLISSISPPQDKVRQSLEQQPQKQEKAVKPLGARSSALDRFVR